MLNRNTRYALVEIGHANLRECAKVQSAIDSMIGKGDMTVIIIAHRLSTIRKADSIAVVSGTDLTCHVLSLTFIRCALSGGQVVEQGTHEELIQAHGTYWNLVNRQVNSV